MTLSEATDHANAVIAKLKPFSEIILIAGSIRREKPEPGDIEIVALPCRVRSTDLFGGETFSTHPEWIKTVNGLGKIIKGKPDGRYIQIELQPEILLDLFMPVKSDFYRQFAIRTGSADYSGKVIASAWVRNGWVGTQNGLRRRNDCRKDSNVWVVVNTAGEKPPCWQTEKEFFEWIKVEWKEPKDRN